MESSDERAAPPPGLLRIADAAREVGVSPSALRLWERQGLVAPRRAGTRERRYGPTELERLRRIRHMRAVEGLNAAGIRRLLGAPTDSPGGHAGAGAASQSAGTAEPEVVGARLRALRNRAGRSLREVSRRTGLSASLVSGLERGTTGASVATLVRLAGAYGTTVAALVGAADAAPAAAGPADHVVRHDRRRSVEAGGGVRIEELATLTTQLEPQLFVLAPGASSQGAYTHAGEEFMFVLAGRVAVWLDERACHELDEGDALTFPSTLPHRFVALGRDETRILWVNTPPTF